MEIKKIKKFTGSLNPIFINATSQEEGYSIDKESNGEQQFFSLPITSILPNANQPRKHFDLSTLKALAQSIESQGVIQPILVKKIKKGNYEIIVGERRWRAAKLAGLKDIPVIISQQDDKDRMLISLIENIQRDNLNPLEEAQAIQQIIEKTKLTQQQIADSLGKSRVTVTNLVRLMKLEEPVKTMVLAGQLEGGHARALLGLSGEIQVEAAQLIIKKQLTVRESEQLIKRLNSIEISPRKELDERVEIKCDYLTDTLSQKLSSKVKIHVSKGGHSRVVIHFDSLDDVEQLINKIG